ncbi:hypothetical protein RAM19_04590 [Bartonella apihabitans]|nr:hypothetical protein [Bartonella apihabitans]WLT09442.1 hypothetical protein RAM19_04590 [Bartonella apihabitans]
MTKYPDLVPLRYQRTRHLTTTVTTLLPPPSFNAVIDNKEKQ